MNQTFNLHRFVLMVKLEFTEKGKNYLLMAGLLIVLLLLMLTPIALYNEPSGFREALHYMALFMIVLFGSSLYTGSGLTQYTTTDTGIAALMIPASRTEKFLSSLIANLIFIVPFLIFYAQLHYFTIDLANEKSASNAYKYSHINPDYLRYFTYFYFAMHSFVFLGSIHFAKSSYIKTAIIIVVICLVGFFLHVYLANAFTSRPTKINTLPLAGWQVWTYDIRGNSVMHQNTKFYHVMFSDNIYILIQAFPVFLTLAFWYAAFLKLKEKQI
ncbi:hypothetical protein [Dyadobacter sp. CY326]|uniref:hypothetical protein n=1 Tax=Dyadobacter sp. CY326 TaxID=2907300 RepID=UPI001F442750|nr:hypothetical protein [Dyadobacter sp. CY326]MCE7066719.1 hypothetical protein [Dyadobacter sp. CY326]